MVDADGHITHAPRSRFVDFLRPGDLVVANDAATLPASLHGVHVRSGGQIEVRLASRSSLAADDIQFSAVIFGDGDFHTRTEDRPLPPAVAPGDLLTVRALSATSERHGAGRWGPASGASMPGGSGPRIKIDALLNHSRLVLLRFEGSPRAVWEGLARHGRPIQYAHIPDPLAMWDVWTPIAGLPVAFEPPSAGFALDWKSIHAMRERGTGFATITLAAGISSTGDPDLDRRLPFNEPYRIPESTASAISRTRMQGGRIIAVGTTVVRALEHAAVGAGLVRGGDGVADQRIGPGSRLRVVDAILSGTHEAESSHYQMLRAFVDDTTLAAASAQLEARGYRTHEFGDSVLIERKFYSVTRGARICDRDETCVATAA